MAIDIQGLNDNLLKVSKNYDEAVRKWVDLALAPAADIPVEYYDQNGNLIQTTVPNRAKLFNDLLVNVNSAMYRTYYVDAINGNDNNDGSQTSPFATIRKAVTSAPTGGIVVVNAIGDYTINDEVERLDIDNKVVYIKSVDINNPTNLTINQNNGANIIAGTGKVVITFFQNISINFNADVYSPIIWSTNKYLGDAWAPQLVAQFVNFSNISLTDNSAGNVIKYLAGYAQLRFAGTNPSTITVNNPASIKFLNAAGWNAIYDRAVSTSIVDSAGNALNDADLIAGVVRDANGTPRNVISNIVL